MTTKTIPSALAIRAFYFCHLMAIGVSLPFFPQYLHGLGFSGRQLALVLAAGPLMHVFTPLVWGWFADRTQRPDLALRIAALCAAICYAPLAGASGFLFILLLHLVHQLFATALPGLSDSLAIARVRHAGDDYGRMRIWGSFAFVLSCFAIGHAIDVRQRTADPLIPLAVSAALLTTFLAGFGLRGAGARVPPRWPQVRTLLRDRRLLFLLVMATIHWGLTTPFHSFFAVLVEDRGLSARVIGRGFAASVISEMIAFLYFRRIVARFSLHRLLAVSMAVSAIRWWLTGNTANPTTLIAAQALHGFTFGVFWATAVVWLGRCVPEDLRATGQTLLTASAFGLGNLFGTLGTGVLYDLTGSAIPAFNLAAAASTTAAVLVLTLGRRMAP